MAQWNVGNNPCSIRFRSHGVPIPGKVTGLCISFSSSTKWGDSSGGAEMPYATPAPVPQGPCTVCWCHCHTCPRQAVLTLTSWPSSQGHKCLSESRGSGRWHWAWHLPYAPSCHSCYHLSVTMSPDLGGPHAFGGPHSGAHGKLLCGHRHVCPTQS